MKLIVLTSCTGEKLLSPKGLLTQADFRHLGTDHFRELEAALKPYSTIAEEMYTGQQHLRLMRGVRHMREMYGPQSVELFIVSAGYGLVSGDRKIVPYECTFQSMRASEISKWADHLRLPQTCRQVLSTNADMTIVLLGGSYLRALKLDQHVTFAPPTIFLTGMHSQRHVPRLARVQTVVLTNGDAKRFSCGQVGLKGEIASRLLRLLAEQGDKALLQIAAPQSNLLDLVEAWKAVRPLNGIH